MKNIPSAPSKSYEEIKEKYNGAIILFREGSYYQTFGKDAKVAADVLGLTIVQQLFGEGEMVLLPFQSLELSVHALVQSGFKVAVCDPL